MWYRLTDIIKYDFVVQKIRKPRIVNELYPYMMHIHQPIETSVFLNCMCIIAAQYINWQYICLIIIVIVWTFSDKFIIRNGKIQWGFSKLYMPTICQYNANWWNIDLMNEQLYNYVALCNMKREVAMSPLKWNMNYIYYLVVIIIKLEFNLFPPSIIIVSLQRWHN